MDLIQIISIAGAAFAVSFGAIGPALIPETLGRLKPDAIVATITHGRQQTQMPAFGETLTADQIVVALTSKQDVDIGTESTAAISD